VIKGAVTSLTDFGAFVKIDGVEGLLHNQDVSWDKGVKARDLFKKGDEVEVKIARINRDDQKISLNHKCLQESPIDKFAASHSRNEIVTGTIRDIKDFGVFVSLKDGVDALIRDEDLEPLVKEELEIGQEIEAVIAVIDTQRDRIRLSVKQLSRLKDQKIIEDLNKEDTGNTLGDLLKDKLNK
jgi:small subunit ribosomal protein S1